MRPKLALLGLVLACLPMTAKADPACLGLVMDLRQRIERDYVGYAAAVAADSRKHAGYLEFARSAEARAAQTSEADCTHELRRFVAWFNDPHLFILEQPRLTEAEARDTRAAAETIAVPRPAGPAPSTGLAGLWKAPEFDAVIVPEGSARGRFVAIVDGSRNENWNPGDVAARFVETDGVLSATLYRTEDRAPIRYRAALQRDGQLLHMPPLTWGRRTAPPPFDPSRPRAPTFQVLGPDAALVALPSFSPEHQPAIDALIAAHDADIRARRLLILDLRGNEGGSPALGYRFAPYYYSDRMGPRAGPRVHPRAVSSRAMIRYYDAIRDGIPEDSGDRPFFDDFIRRMEAAPGELIPYFEDPALAARLLAQSPPTAIYPTPDHVAILVDRHSVSAAEAFLIEAMRSPRVTVFGENTGGSIDYQNVALFDLGDGRLHHKLGMPVVAASDELPDKGFNPGGVPVAVSLIGHKDWVDSVFRHFGMAR